MLCIYRTDDLIEANFIKDTLEGAGILTILQSNDASGTLLHYRAFNPVEIYIHEEDEELAFKLLSR